MTRDEVQPYFRAFMVDRGYHDSAEAKNLEYLLWNGARWREFDALNGKSHIGFRSIEERTAFGRWLEARSAPSPTLFPHPQKGDDE